MIVCFNSTNILYGAISWHWDDTVQHDLSTALGFDNRMNDPPLATGQLRGRSRWHLHSSTTKRDYENGNNYDKLYEHTDATSKTDEKAPESKDIYHSTTTVGVATVGYRRWSMNVVQWLIDHGATDNGWRVTTSTHTARFCLNPLMLAIMGIPSPLTMVHPTRTHSLLAAFH
jgi:hypothetical protein